MRPTDVDALLRRLLPALTLGVAGCSGTTPASGADDSPLQASAQVDGEAPEGVEAGAGDEGASGGAEPKPDLPLEAIAPPDRWDYPPCPTETWCVPQAAAVKVAVNAERSQDDCPVQVDSDISPSLTAPKAEGENLAGDRTYSQLLL